MDEHVLEHLLEGLNAINAGANGREVLCMQADEEYRNGNILNSIFYQVMMLYQTFQARYGHVQPSEEMHPKSVKEIRKKFNTFEENDFQSNKLMQHVYQELLKVEESKGAVPKSPNKEKSFDFLVNVQNPQNGLRQIRYVCQMMPPEWTIIQLYKGSRADTTYSVYNKIKEAGTPIYLTILRHARSSRYPNPICLRFDGPEIDKLYENHSQIAKTFKEYIIIDSQKIQLASEKQKYWQRLTELDNFIEKTLKEFRQAFFPWSFLFTGSPVENTVVLEQMGNAFVAVDGFCSTYNWDTKERVLLSLAALHISSLTESEIAGISKILSANKQQMAYAIKLLTELQLAAALPKATKADAPRRPAKKLKNQNKFNPCILIVDERLDFFYWEELNVTQEFCRVGSLHWLWRLYEQYKQYIVKGYLMLNVQTGGCLLNPDGSLKNMEMRMKSFFKYWTPHWQMKYSELPKPEEICKYFQRDCYVFSGHGSGLQFVHGKTIAKQQIKSVVFLFGCDSTVLRSSGLYSELIGSHYYYHAAMCPAVIGCILPGLDANMDMIASSLLSRWIAPNSNNVMAWDEVDIRTWKKTGTIKAKKSEPPKPVSLVIDSPDYHAGSLCELISRVHQRRFEPHFYNTIGYVCRGLPVWNINVQRLC